ncbi:nuclear transport factor 2 family protein, partial [Longispora fulva]|uniref:nuclear transport factor 2 family protein n=2 Tax=Bacteria TaxID=2 RepID=UPI00363848F6
MKNLLLICLLVAGSISLANAQTSEKENINTLLNQWHKAAAEANFDAYFSKMADESIFIGTDPTENWDKQSFMNFSKPYFDKGKAW